MVVYVLGPTFEREATIDTYTSLIWTKRARACGDFELYMRADAQIAEALFSGPTPRFLVREKDVLGPRSYRNVMRIDGRGSAAEYKSAAETGDWMTVTGTDLKSLLYQRVIYSQTVANATIPNIVTALLNANIISPSYAARAISGFTRGTDDLVTPEISTETVSRQWTGDNLGEAVQELLDTRNLMFDVEIVDGQYALALYEGRDRSLDQTALDYVVFSYGFENLISSNYKEGRAEDFANAAYVGGEGEGSDRTVVGAATVGAEGVHRFELWVDARNSSSNDGEITAAQYRAQLKQEGVEAYTETQERSAPTFDAEIDLTSSPFKLGRDFHLNDVVQIDGQFAQAAARVTEVIESESDKGPQVVAKFAIFNIEQEPEPPAALRSIKTETGDDLITEGGTVIIAEDEPLRGALRSGSAEGVKISELPAGTPTDALLLPLADAGVETYKSSLAQVQALFKAAFDLLYATQDAATQSAAGLLSAADKTKLDGIAAGAQVNPSPSTSTPLMDGTATAGTSDAYARGNHRHPKDTSKANLASPTFTGTPKAPTAAAGTNTTQIATTAFVQAALTAALAGYKERPVTLFTGDATGDVSLSASAADYAMLEIFFEGYNGRSAQSIKVLSPNGRTIDLSVTEPSLSSGVRIRVARYTISGTGITLSTVANTNGNMVITAGGNMWTNGNVIHITRVDGYATY